MVGRAQELERAKRIVAALGAPDNITDTVTCITRLRVGVNDPAAVDLAALRRIRGVYGVLAYGYEVQVVLGFKAAAVEAWVQDVLDAERPRASGSVRSDRPGVRQAVDNRPPGNRQLS